MSPARRDRVDEVVMSALELAPEERGPFLSRECGSDLDLLADAKRLVAAHDAAPSFLESAAFESGRREASNRISSALAGRQVGRYRLLRVIGSGGMGLVYEAEQDKPRRKVALKLVRAELASEQVLRRFEHEAHVLGRLQHRGIAQVFEAGTARLEGDDGPAQPFLAMELVRGKPITEYAEERNLGIRERLDLLIQVCRAVEHAHQKGIIHRDLKPANILVADDDPIGTASGVGSVSAEIALRTAGCPKILDFGVARVTGPETQISTLLTQQGQILGTIPYMSPEQVSGDPDMLDTRTDVYSLGVIAYELLGRRLPYDLSQKTIPEAVRIITDVEPRPLGSLDRAFRGDLNTIVAKALEKEKSRRYSSAAELGADIRRFLEDQPIQARQATAGYQLRKLVARHKAGFALSLLLLLSIAAFGVVATVQAVDLARQRDAAMEARTRETEARTAAEATAEFLESLFLEADPSRPDGKDPTLREVLDAGSENLREGLKDQPLVRARLLAVMGNVYGRLGAGSKAKEMLEEAVELRRVHLGADHIDVTKALVQLAMLQCQLGELPAAEAVLEEVLSIRQEQLPADDPFVAEALNDLGLVRYYAGDFQGAEDGFRRAYEMRKRLYGGKHAEIAQSLTNLAWAAKGSGRHKEAIELLRESLIMRRSLEDVDHELAVSYKNLAHMAWAAGDPSGAEAAMAQALEFARQTLSPSHPTVAAILHDYAYLLCANHGAARGVPVYEEALAMRREAFGEDHPLVADTLSDLGTEKMRLGDLAEAEAMLVRAVEIRRGHFDAHDGRVRIAVNNLAMLYQNQGRHDEAEILLRELLATAMNVNGALHSEVSLAAHNLGACLFEQGEYDEAEKLYLQAQEIDRSLEEPYLGRSFNQLGILHRARGDFTAAAEHFRRACEEYASTNPDTKSALISVKGNLAMALCDLERFEEARPHVEESLELAERYLPADHGAVVPPLSTLAKVFHARGERAEATRLIRRALGICRAKFRENDTRLAACLVILASFLCEDGGFVEAEPLAREGFAILSGELPEGNWRTAQAETVLGRCLLGLGRMDEAEPCLEAGLAVLGATLGPDHRDTRRALDSLIELNTRAGRPGAVAVYRELMEETRPGMEKALPAK